ncbi:MAG TPA: hypothetical protein PLD83_04770, partial [Oscillospiraceae bacterium]|nr:hypothetical protein [Oscillospiraceae bacterium]
LGGIGTLLSLLLGVSISKMISWPVQKFTMFAKMMAVGDLDLGKYVDERYKRVFLSSPFASAILSCPDFGRVIFRV